MPDHTCEFCDAKFQRAEHLARHKLLHLGDRPFGCSRCDRTFARRDTLQRHLSVHAKQGDRSSLERGAGRRTKRACRNCSRGKQRCDGAKPCSRCVSKHVDCFYRISSSHESHGTENLASGPKNDNAPDNTQSDDMHSHWQSESNAHNGDSLGSVAASASQSIGSQPDFASADSTYTTLPLVPSYFGDMSFSDPSNLLQQTTAQADSIAGFQASITDRFAANVENIAFWNDPQYLATFYQGPYTDFDFVLPMGEPRDTEILASFHDSGAEESAGSPPAPSFLDARSSPEPLEGQGLRFDEYIRKAFGNRRHLRNQGATHQDRERITSSSAPEKAHIPPLMGDFLPVLSSRENAILWEPEDLAHVRSLPQQVYDLISALYERFNATDGQYTQFASGSFPSLAACNAFIQLFFEEFNPLFPLLHQPTFDPASEPWILVLAVIATGCRFSRISAAVESGDLMQEFLRRAFFAMMEEDYSSTCEPWLAQAGLLNQIGMAFSKDMRLIQTAQSNRSLLSSICRQVNCFRESQNYSDLENTQQSFDDIWRTWIRRESMRRLAHLLWFVDSQYVLFFDLPPLIPMNLLQLRLPCSESLWQAPTASAWLECSKQKETYVPLSLRQELNNLYKTSSRQRGLGDFAILLLVVGIFRNAMNIQRVFHEGLSLLPNTVQDAAQLARESGSMSDTFPATYKAMEYLRILCPENKEMAGIASLKSMILHHYHAIGILLSIPLGELFCFCGYRVTTADISRSEVRLKAWVEQRGGEARRMVLHASRLFAYIRQSNMYGYYEGRAMLIACQALWVYAATAGSIRSINSRDGAKDRNEHHLTSRIRLDQLLTRQAEESWLQNGQGMRPYLAGVGSIADAGCVARLVEEGSRIMCAGSRWPQSEVLGKCLRIYYQLRAGKN